MINLKKNKTKSDKMQKSVLEDSAHWCEYTSLTSHYWTVYLKNWLKW